MNKYEETADTWNKLADLYQDKFMNLDLYNESYDSFCNKITSANAQILEIGCGPGNISKYLFSKRKDFSITGIDVAPKMIKLAKKNNPKGNFLVMDAREINRLTTKYDGIIAGFCLPYLAEGDVIKLITACADLLNDKGILYLSFVDGNPEKSAYQTGSNGKQIYFYYHSLENLKQLITHNGFSELKISTVNYIKNDDASEVHTIILSKKI